MRLVKLRANNFRGIQKGNFDFPSDKRLLCIIGAGDSCKSTLLTAIQWCLWPSYALIINDADFYNADTTQEIIIEATLAEVPGVLLTEDKFGLYLRDANAVQNNDADDEPKDGRERVLTVQLKIDNSLEPEWNVITNRQDPKPISARDRKILSLGVVGDDYDKDFQWGRNSILQNYATDSKTALHTAYTKAIREAVQRTDLSDLDKATVSSIKNTGEEYGVSFNGDLHNSLIMQNGSYSTTVGIYDGKVPFSLRGLGSRRLLSIGLNINAADESSLILIDEIETGLEPYRIVTLINDLRKATEKNGQVIITTHSRSVICECTAKEILIMKNQNGLAALIPIAENTVVNDIQRNLRSDPDAFLSKSLIICEGKTEQGILRAFDNYLFEKDKKRFAYYGVGVALASGGNECFKLADLFTECGYHVCVFMDADKDDEDEKKMKLIKKGISIFSWDKPNAIEEQIFHDVGDNVAEKLLQLACDFITTSCVMRGLDEQFLGHDKPYQLIDGDIHLIRPCLPEIKRELGSAAKKSNKDNKHKYHEWYKRIDRGEAVGDVLFSSYDEIPGNCTFKTTMEALKKWVISNETGRNSEDKAQA